MFTPNWPNCTNWSSTTKTYYFRAIDLLVTAGNGNFFRRLTWIRNHVIIMERHWNSVSAKLRIGQT